NLPALVNFRGLELAVTHTSIVRRGPSVPFPTAYVAALLASTALLVVPAPPALAQDGAQATTLPTVVIEGESATGPDNSVVAKRSRSASKTDTPLVEIPQAVSVVTRKQMDE